MQNFRSNKIYYFFFYIVNYIFNLKKNFVFNLFLSINKKTKDVVINMYKQKLNINLISSYVNIKKEEVEKIIQDYLSLNKKD